MKPEYLCPKTRTPLHLDGNTLRPASGDISYQVKDGIPQFLQFESIEDEGTRTQLDELNQLAEENGWQEALHTIYGKDAAIVNYVTAGTRSSFMDLLSLTKQMDVLEIGPGLGQFTPYLAKQTRSVCALEVVPGQATFTAKRCKQENVSNVHVAVGGDDCRLPYPDGTFDLVVVNLVLEWCASRCLNEPIISAQRRFLDEISRVLNSHGRLYVATKNRFALRHLIGKADEHCYGLRFGSALPRWLSSALLKIKGHDRPCGLLHSYTGLKKLLGDSGLTTTQTYWAVPEMRYANRFIATDADSIAAARSGPNFVQGEMRSTSLLMPLVPGFLVKYVTPGLAFIASKI
jgi:SAM-dependent methyltransferase